MPENGKVHYYNGGSLDADDTDKQIDLDTLVDELENGEYCFLCSC